MFNIRLSANEEQEMYTNNQLTVLANSLNLMISTSDKEIDCSFQRYDGDCKIVVTVWALDEPYPFYIYLEHEQKYVDNLFQALIDYCADKVEVEELDGIIGV